MKEREKELLVKIIKNNAIYPLIIQGINSGFFKNGVIVDCKNGANQLALTINEQGVQQPSFLTKLEAKKDARKFLVFENLEDLSKEEQYSFVGFFKHRGMTGYKLSADIQIIIVTKDVESLAKEITDLSLIYKVKM